MSRPQRIIYEDAWYHVMNRGAGRQKIFNDRADREIFWKHWVKRVINFVLKCMPIVNKVGVRV